ncbi:MAG TPA: InlB B-repeat-containing protein [Candidatus Acidoferrum sp.]|nr:InlB B-repeat-containing protein [Candidatus Acidoferrum sp.]
MRINQKLTALNLALLLMLAPFFGLFAYARDAGAYVPGDRACAQGEGEDACAYPSQAREVREREEEGEEEQEDAMPAGMSDDMEALSNPYRIYVGSTSFYSNQNASGTGWEYTASNNRLILDGYSGSSIRTSGDLVIYSYGSVNITGPDGAYGSNALTVGGYLDFVIFDGTATVAGGSGSSYSGGDGIQASSLFVVGFDDTVFICTGGDGATYGGDGIYGDSISLYPDNAMIEGGDGETYGGYGIYGDSIELYPDTATIEGGAGGDYPGSGIHFISELYIGVCHMTVQGGGESEYIITSQYGDYFYFSIHMTLTEPNSYTYAFAPKIYELTLNGNGGKRSGVTYAYVNGVYPTTIDLGNYLFSRSGYSQVGWATASNLSPSIPLSGRYLMTSDTTLYASWTDVDGGTVLFVGNGGTMDGVFFAKTGAGPSVRVLDENDVSAIGGIGPNLLGWTDSLELTVDENNMLCSESRWYLPGATAALSGETTLYAQWSSSHGNIIYYDGNGGENGVGSPAAVQGILTSASSLSLYVRDDLTFERAGYRFGGWEDAAGTPYPQGTEIPTPASGRSVTELFARWLRTFVYTASSPEVDGHVSCTLTPELGTVDVWLTVDDATSIQAGSVNVFYALYRDNRLIGLASNTVALSSNSMENRATVEYMGSYEPDTCKVFITADDFSPACGPLVCPFD